MKHWLLLVFPAVFIFLVIFLVIRSPPEPEILPTVASQATHTPVPVPTWTPAPTATFTPTPRPTATFTPIPTPVSQVTGDRVNVRNGPGTAWKIENYLLAGHQLTLETRTEDGKWLQIAENLWIFRELTDVTLSQAMELPVGTWTAAPIPTAVPTAIDWGEEANLWIQISRAGPNNKWEVFADSAIDLNPRQLEVNISGRVFCNVYSLLADGGPRQLQCAELPDHIQNPKVYSATGYWQDGYETLPCEFRGTKRSSQSVTHMFACTVA